MSCLHMIQGFRTNFWARIDDILDKAEGYDETFVNLIGTAEDEIYGGTGEATPAV